MPKIRLTPQEALEDLERPLRESVRQYMDYDYFYSLSREDKAWLNQFNRVYYLDMKATVTKLKVKNREQRELYIASHSRRRCINLTTTKCTALPQTVSTPSPLDGYIEMLDLKYSSTKKNSENK